MRTRFAPSPTGDLHIGSARTALFNYLLAKNAGGTFILRIEDTDAARSTAASLQGITDGLRWLGISWDEGPDLGGAHGPYTQSERHGFYQRHLNRLIASGHAYEDTQGAVRFRVPEGIITVDDQICGPSSIDLRATTSRRWDADLNREVEADPDFVIRRADGSFIFHFVNVVDDLEMEITHVLRGEDHLPNTPKHIALFQALDAPPPIYAHMPLTLDETGKKLSKRHGGGAISNYQQGGFLPESVVNYLCLLGWSPKDDREFLSLEEIIPLFDFAHMQRHNARFDMEKCRWLSGQHLQALAIDDLTFRALPFLKAAGIPTHDTAAVAHILSLVREKIRTLDELPAWFSYFYGDTFPIDPDVAPALVNPQARHALETIAAALLTSAPLTQEALQETIATAATAAGYKKPGQLMFPLRAATTGRKGGPDLLALLAFIGPARTATRIQNALSN